MAFDQLSDRQTYAYYAAGVFVIGYFTLDSLLSATTVSTAGLAIAYAGLGGWLWYWFGDIIADYRAPDATTDHAQSP